MDKLDALKQRLELSGVDTSMLQRGPEPTTLALAAGMNKVFNEERYEGKTIEDLRTEIAAKTGENVRIARFSRFEVGGA